MTLCDGWQTVNVARESPLNHIAALGFRQRLGGYTEGLRPLIRMTIASDPAVTAFATASPDLSPRLRPVAVTRWTARLVDPACERADRQDSFAGGRRRLLLLMALMAVAGLMILLGRFYEHLFDHHAAVFLV
ncbi:MAG: hypothetical protein P8Z80_11340 [Pseudolabrys sp.]